MQSRFVIFLSKLKKSFRESERKETYIQDKKMLLFIHGGGWVTERSIIMKEFVLGWLMQPDNM